MATDCSTAYSDAERVRLSDLYPSGEGRLAVSWGLAILGS